MDGDWLLSLLEWVREYPCVIIRLDCEEWTWLSESSRGIGEFTLARSHKFFERVRVPTLCLAFAKTEEQHLVELKRPRRKQEHKSECICYAGILSSRAAVTSLETRVKVERALEIFPSGEAELVELLGDSMHATRLRERLSNRAPIISLSPELSRNVVEAIAAFPQNEKPLRTVATGLRKAQRFSDPRALQEDAIHTALRAFGLEANLGAKELSLVHDRSSGLDVIPIREDVVIQHDARHIPGFEYVGGSITGRAVFENRGGRLEVITANRQPLEEVFGVDLIYLNLVQRNLVMVQYKMLDPGGTGVEADWIYRPDQSLEVELARMKSFAISPRGSDEEYRLNNETFYLKFVQRNARLTNASIVIPLGHFEQIIDSPRCRGPRGGVRISYLGLTGSYMRNGTFIDLVQSGYIGTFSNDTRNFQALIQAVMDCGHSVVGALQTASSVNEFEVYARKGR